MGMRHVYNKTPAKNNKKIFTLVWTEDDRKIPSYFSSDALPPLKIKSKNGVQELNVSITSSAVDDEVLLHKLLSTTRGYLFSDNK